jgi:hypothetical protein
MLKPGIQTGIDHCNQIKAEQPTLERETGIEPVSLAWKAKVLPLNYSRPANPPPAPKSQPWTQIFTVVEEAGFEPAYA